MPYDLARIVKLTLISLFATYSGNFIYERFVLKRKQINKDLLKKAKFFEDIDLNEYEAEILTQIVNPDDIDVTFDDIGSLNDVISFIKTDIITLIKNPNLVKSSKYFRPPKGVLLYGPPGCGKTMLVKATAKECNTRFINLSVSMLTNKWYGESVKLASAVFTLARKLSPCIIFIDEIDTFLRSRSFTDHEITLMMKAEFLKKWDGFSNDPLNRVILIGATNRRSDIDNAILSRMDLQFEINYPNLDERICIFKKLTKNLSLDKNVNISEILKQCENLSGRDLNDLCREANMFRLREHIKNNKNQEEVLSLDDNLRKVTTEDFIFALKNIKKKL